VLVPANQLIPTQNVVEVASSVPDLSSLVTALVATGLDTVLSVGNGVYTVFAPTNAAFAKIPLYIATNNTLLKQVLLYHVINDRTYAENLLPGNTNITVATLNGQSINVLLTTAPVRVTVFGNAAGNKANVTTADVDSTNAVVHVIDTVSCRGGWENNKISKNTLSTQFFFLFLSRRCCCLRACLRRRRPCRQLRKLLFLQGACTRRDENVKCGSGLPPNCTNRARANLSFSPYLPLLASRRSSRR
jgi:uncharacterized surface protein with fasciclin (FAS1) repeats